MTARRSSLPRRAVVIWVIWAIVLSSCSRDKKQPDASSRPEAITFEPFPRGPGTLEIDHWYTVALQDKPAGWVHVTATLHDTSRGKRRVITVDEEVSLLRGSERVKISSNERVLEDHRGRLLRINSSESEAGGEQIVVQAGKVDQEMITRRGPEIIHRPFEEAALGAQRPFEWILEGKDLKPGDSFAFRTYVRMTAGYSDNRLRVIGVPGDDRGYLEVEQTIDAMPGMIQRFKLDDSFNPQEVESTLGALRLKFKRVEGKPESGPAREVPDLTGLMQVETNVEFADRDKVVKARYRIDGLPDFVDAGWLTGPGQKVVGHPMVGTYVIEVTRMPRAKPLAFPMEISDPDLQVYLESTALAQAGDAGIISTARQVTEGAPDAWEAARRLRRWVTDEVSNSMGMGFASAGEVFRRKKGDCSEQSVLLAALARASGIPARCVMGLVYAGPSFARHMWSEVWIGEWRPLDAAMGVDAISAAWIRLGVYSLKLTDNRRTGMGGMLAFASDIKITVQEHESVKP